LGEPLVTALEAFAASVGDDLIFCMLAHHGAPVTDPPNAPRMATFWTPTDRYDPTRELLKLLMEARERYPDAFISPTADGVPLLAPSAVSLYAGLLTLADWIGSDTTRFEIDGVTGEERERRSRRKAAESVDGLGLDNGARLRSVLGTPTFKDAFDVESPYSMQSIAGEAGTSRVVVLESETGSGKTEAALWRFVRLFAAGEIDGLYFALPTRTSAVQIHARIQAMLDRLFGTSRLQAVLAVPGYLQAGDEKGIRQEAFQTLWPDRPGDRLEDARWAAESPKRFLSARVAVGTVDQALLSGLEVRHAHLRATTLSRTLLVVDEVHASDTYMSTVLTRVIENHTRAGGHVLLLSATLGSTARQRFLNDEQPVALDAAINTPYPALHRSGDTPVELRSAGRVKDVRVECSPWIDAHDRVASCALEAARSGARVLVIRNTVGDAVATLDALERLTGFEDHVLRAGGLATLHHGRFAPDDRRLLDNAVERTIGKKRADRAGCVVIGTQTLEISLDLDADLLLTDLCPMDVLLQRIGRLHRHARGYRPPGYESARVSVLTPVERDLTPFTKQMPSEQRHGLGPMDRMGGGVYANLESIEATWRLIESRDTIAIPTHNRLLVEMATHTDELERISNECEWERTRIEHEGSMLHDEATARRFSIRMEEPFSGLEPFPTDEERPGTRLGTSDWRFEIAEPMQGPFGVPLTAVTIPAWMGSDIKLEDEVIVERDEEGLVLIIGVHRYRYDRKGLRKQ